MAAEAPILLADEPTEALDPLHQHQVLSLIRTYADAGNGALVVLHEAALAARFADRLAWIREGRIVADGPPRGNADAGTHGRCVWRAGRGTAHRGRLGRGRLRAGLEPCVGRQRGAGAGGFETRPYIGCPVPAAQTPSVVSHKYGYEAARAFWLSARRDDL